MVSSKHASFLLPRVSSDVGWNWCHVVIFHQSWVLCAIALYLFDGGNICRDLVGVGLHYANSVMIWRFPFGFQLVPAGILAFGLLTVKVHCPLLYHYVCLISLFIGISTMARLRQPSRGSHC